MEAMEFPFDFDSFWIHHDSSNRVEEPQSICDEAERVHNQNWKKNKKSFRCSLEKADSKFQCKAGQERAECVPASLESEKR